MRRQSSFLLGLVSMAGFLLVGCSSTPKNEQTAETGANDARNALQKFQDKDPSLKGVLDSSAAYAVFPSVGKGGFIVGAAYGKGTVFVKDRVVGYADIKQGSIGLQAGAQDYSELLIFKDDNALRKFQAGNYALSAEASAVALKAGAAANADFKEGVAVFTMTNSGVMAEAAVAGQKFDYTSKGEVERTDTNTQNGNETTHTETTTHNP